MGHRVGTGTGDRGLGQCVETENGDRDCKYV